MSQNFVGVDTMQDLKARHSSKWRRYAPDVLPMHVAEMDFVLAEPIKRVLRDLIDHNDLGYMGPIPELGEAFAGYAKRHWGWNVDPRKFRLATDVGVATVEFLRANSQPGDAVVHDAHRVLGRAGTLRCGWIGARRVRPRVPRRCRCCPCTW